MVCGHHRGASNLGDTQVNVPAGDETVPILRLWSAFIVERALTGPSRPIEDSYKTFD